MGDDVERLFLARPPWERVPERGGQPPREELCSSESESGAERERLMDGPQHRGRHHEDLSSSSARPPEINLEDGE